jgi:ABC-type tungstate transport system substrate-binding protein
VLTTAAVLEVNKGQFGSALALGFILLAFIVVIATVLTTVQQRAHRR